MKDFTRLAVGILLLGLAIFMSMNLDEPKTADSAATDDAPAAPGEQPDWQAPPEVDEFTKSPANQEIVKPDFDQTPALSRIPPQRTPPTEPEPVLSNPPRISDQYQPLQSLAVTGQIRRESQLVPVQPKPSFTGSISYSQRVHVIRENDTLQSIAREYFGTADRYLDIYLVNKDVLSNPARLPAGVEIRIPAE